MTKKILLILFLFFVPAYLNAQNHEWDKLASLPKGKKIVVQLSTGGDIKGKLIRVEREQLLMEHRNEEIRLKKENIAHVIAGKKFTGRRVWIGSGIGFVAGAVIGTYFGYAMGASDAGSLLGLGAGFGLLGATTGAAVAVSGEDLDGPSRHSIRIRW
jgi:hypothetical protein